MITDDQARDAASSISAIELVDFDADARTLLQWASQELSRRDAERIERAKPIDAEWLLEIGFEPLLCGGIGLMRQTGHIEFHPDGRWVVNCLAYKPGHFTTRGQLLDLLAALKGGA